MSPRRRPHHEEETTTRKLVGNSLLVGVATAGAIGSGCAGLVTTGDKVALAATYGVAPHITIRPTP